MFQDPLPPFDFYSWPRQAEPESPDLAVAPDAGARSYGADGSRRHACAGTCPTGEWIVLRAAMTPTGTKNSPSPPEATGLEVDKMNRDALKAHFDAYVGEPAEADAGGRTQGVEACGGGQLRDGPAELDRRLRGRISSKRYGYDPMPWLPVLTGRIVGSADQSDRFLWDLRRLVADRVARDYVGGLRDLCHAARAADVAGELRPLGFPRRVPAVRRRSPTRSAASSG